jgi:hypothetical protein
MTTEELALSSVKERGAQPEKAKALACAFCRRRLADEYFFTCRKCDASYCYIHTSRHQPTLCARQVGRRRRDQTAALPQPQNGGVRLAGEYQFLFAGPDSGCDSSANV